MNMKSTLAVSAFAFGATLASAQLTIATGVAGISGSATLNVVDTSWDLYYRPNSGEGVLSGPNAEWRQSTFAPTFSGAFLDTTGFNSIDAQAVSQAGLGAWVDPRLVSTFDNEARWIAPTTSNIVNGTLVTDGNLISDYEANSLTTQTNRVGDYFYTIQFTLDATNFGTMSVAWATDNRSDVYVNGNFVASKGLPAVSTITSATVAPSFLVLGTNELVVVVRNENVGIASSVPVRPGASENPTGLVLVATAIPEPSTYALLAGLGAIALAVIRRRK